MPTTNRKPLNTTRQVLFASLVGTSVEFFDFYIYATAAVLVFPKLFLVVPQFEIFLREFAFLSISPAINFIISQ